MISRGRGQFPDPPHLMIFVWGRQRKVATNNGKKILSRKKIIIFVTAAAVVVAGSGVAVFALQKKNSSASTSNYREYSVTQGDVTVGTTESGTVALNDQSVAFPVQCTVGSVLVKSGQQVKKGDPLVQLDLTSVSSSTSDLRQKLEAAKNSLQQAAADQKNKLETAKITYQSSLYLATAAPITHDLTLGDVQNAVTSAQNALANDQSDLATYTALQKSWPADYAKLQNLKKWMNNASTAKTDDASQLANFNSDNSAVLSNYNSLKNTMNTDEANYVTAKATGNEVNGKDMNEWYTQFQSDETALNAYTSQVASSILSKQTSLEQKEAQDTAEFNNYTSAYNDFQDTYNSKYKLTGSDLDAKVASLQNNIKTDQYNLQKAQKTAQISSANADTAEQNGLAAANSAQDNYNLTVNQLAQAVSSAQTNYDNLETQMTEINNALNGNGTIKSPCDGFVAQVNDKAGSSVQANAAMLVISESDNVSMDVSVSEDDIPNVKIGQDASITLSSQDSASAIDAVVDSITAEPARSGSSSVSYTVVVKSKAPVSGLGTVYDGMSGEASIIQKQVKNVLYVNNKAVTFQNGQSTVLLKGQNGSPVTQEVTTGFSDGTSVEITSGLQKGDTVLAESAVASK